MGPLHSSLSSPVKTIQQASQSQMKAQKRKRNKSRGPIPLPPMAMEEKMMMLTLPLEPPLPSWKLYDNPHYSHSYSQPSSNPHESPTHPSILPMACGGDSPAHSLQLAHARIEELQVELEFERRMRKRVESLNRALARDLAEERKAREEAESLRAKIQEEVNKKVVELEEERRMLRVAEIWREERVQMKLSEAKIIMEEELQRLGGGGGSVSKTLEPAAPGTPTAVAIDGVGHQRREVENPHIKRGIKGFVEFPKVMKGKAINGTVSAGKDGKSGHVGFNLECQKAQLRILMRQTKNPVGISIVGSTDHLVM